MLRRLFNGYNRLLIRRPYSTQIIGATLITGSGDVIAQLVVEKKREFDFQRWSRFAMLGAVWIAPTLLIWYRLLAHYVSHPLKMVLVDQLLFSPIFLTTILVSLRYLEGCTTHQIYEAWKRDFLDVFSTGLKIWPAVQLVNFYFVPLNYRLLLVQTVSLAWNTYLSNKIQQSKHDAENHESLKMHEEIKSPY